MIPHRSLAGRIVRTFLAVSLFGSALYAYTPRTTLAAPTSSSTIRVPLAPPSPLASPLNPPDAPVTDAT
ncbi:MAG: hypothetical protein M1546_20760, partial [Chloroflexi bacterium]|nr:hypothetical protein [Chloroflexota bacterium]